MAIDVNIRTVCDFLYYGYVPSSSVAYNKSNFYKSFLENPEVEFFTNENGADILLQKIIRQNKLVMSSDYIRIGVTSGYDSRGLLGALLKVIDQEKIVAFTNGQPGNEDYEKSKFFTEGLIEKHFLVPTQNSDFNLESILNSYKKRPFLSPKEISPPKKKDDSLLSPYKNYPQISGFLGDAVSGKRLNGKLSDTYELALFRFIDRNRPFIPRNLANDFFPKNYDPSHFIEKEPFLSDNIMSFDDQFDFFYRQEQRIRLNAGQYSSEELDGYAGTDFFNIANRSRVNTIAFYNDERWIKSFLLLPIEERINQKFYFRFLKSSYPEVFQDLHCPEDIRWKKVKQKTPVSNKRTHTNWEMLYLENENFHEFADKLLSDLYSRKIVSWIDPNMLDELIRLNEYGWGTVLWGLLSLEIAFKSGNLPKKISFE
ncbi:hypothetical protein [Vibrio metschnikovii]|uniref:hypothetical protein n=1 Tax=Vibrio metschnikovii TaxID=28172 RepID=UPI001CCDD4B8|nr:hypothetical protein [Vibrio metschnikovii]